MCAKNEKPELLLAPHQSAPSNHGDRRTGTPGTGWRRGTHSPNALIECTQLGYQLGGPFVLIATQIVDSFYSLRRGLQLIFANANPLVLKPYKLVSDDGSVALLWGTPGWPLPYLQSQKSIQLSNCTVTQPTETRSHRLLCGRLKKLNWIPLPSPSVKDVTKPCRH